jgi:hypothetical protein
MARVELWPWFEAIQDTPLENAWPNSMPVLYVMPKWFLNSKSHLFMQCEERKSRRIGGGVLLSIRRLENAQHVQSVCDRVGPGRIRHDGQTRKKLGRGEAAKGQKSAASELFAHGHDSGTIEKDGPKNSAPNLHQPVAVNLPN